MEGFQTRSQSPILLVIPFPIHVSRFAFFIAPYTNDNCPEYVCLVNLNSHLLVDIISFTYATLSLINACPLNLVLDYPLLILLLRGWDYQQQTPAH